MRHLIASIAALALLAAPAIAQEPPTEAPAAEPDTAPEEAAEQPADKPAAKPTVGERIDAAAAKLDAKAKAAKEETAEGMSEAGAKLDALGDTIEAATDDLRAKEREISAKVKAKTRDTATTVEAALGKAKTEAGGFFDRIDREMHKALHGDDEAPAEDKAKDAPADE